METRIVGGVKVVEVEPDEPLPAGIPLWAERCDLVEQPMYPATLRPWVLGAGVVSTLGCIAVLAFVSHWGMAPLPISLVALYYGLRPATTAVLTPSRGGRYVAFEEGTDRDEGTAASMGRLAALGLGALLLVVSVTQLFSEERDWMAIGMMGMFGFYLLYYGATGEDVRPDAPDPAPSLRFLALADPSRPLAELRGLEADASSEAGDPISIQLDGARRDAAADSGDGS